MHRRTAIPLTAAVTADGSALESFELGLEPLDLGMGLLEILVETIALGNELLLPLPEALFLDLDLLSKPLAQRLFLLLELGVVELPGAGLAKLARLHLLGTVGLVVQLLGGVDEVKHVSADEDRPELLEIAVVLVLHLSNTPRVLTTLDDAAIVRLDILFRADHSERHGGNQAAGVLGRGLVILLDRRLINLDVLGLDDGTDLECRDACKQRTRLTVQDRGCLPSA